MFVEKNCIGIDKESGLPISVAVIKHVIDGEVLIAAYCSMMTYRQRDFTEKEFNESVEYVILEAYGLGREIENVFKDFFTDYLNSLGQRDRFTLNQHIIIRLKEHGYGSYFKHDKYKVNVQVNKPVENDLGLNTNGDFYHVVNDSEKVFDGKDVTLPDDVFYKPLNVEQLEVAWPNISKDVFEGRRVKDNLNILNGINSPTPVIQEMLDNIKVLIADIERKKQQYCKLEQEIIDKINYDKDDKVS